MFKVFSCTHVANLATIAATCARMVSGLGWDQTSGLPLKCSETKVQHPDDRLHLLLKATVALPAGRLCSLQASIRESCSCEV